MLRTVAFGRRTVRAGTVGFRNQKRENRVHNSRDPVEMRSGTLTGSILGAREDAERSLGALCIGAIGQGGVS